MNNFIIPGTKKYFAEVKAELRGIKKYATKEEIKHLNFGVDGRSTFDCVYGLLTGYCYSTRANEIIRLVNPKFSMPMDIKRDPKIIEEPIPEERVAFNFNDAGKPTGRRHHTVLEHCIQVFPENNENIIRYIKGEIEHLTLKAK